MIEIELSDIIITLCFIAIIFGITTVMYVLLKEDFKCDTGLDEIVGDFEVIPNTTFNNHYCAVEDCNKFNKYQSKIGSEEICVV